MLVFPTFRGFSSYSCLKFLNQVAFCISSERIGGVALCLTAFALLSGTTDLALFRHQKIPGGLGAWWVFRHKIFIFWSLQLQRLSRWLLKKGLEMCFTCIKRRKTVHSSTTAAHLPSSGSVSYKVIAAVKVCDVNSRRFRSPQAPSCSWSWKRWTTKLFWSRSSCLKVRRTTLLVTCPRPAQPSPPPGPPPTPSTAPPSSRQPWTCSQVGSLLSLSQRARETEYVVFTV